MDAILDFVKDLPETRIEAGEDILRQGERKRSLYILVEGAVEVLKSGQQICVVKDRGSVFGELSVLLKCFHNASVRTLEPSVFCIIEDAEEFFRANPGAALHVARILARRLALLDSYFAELKREFSDLSAQADQPTPEEKKKSSLLTAFLRRAEQGLEERSQGKSVDDGR